MNKNVKEIIDLIEDEEFPARRNISDYIILLLQDLNVEQSLIQDIENAFNSEYEKRGDQKCFSQSQFRNEMKQLILGIKVIDMPIDFENEARKLGRDQVYKAGQLNLLLRLRELYEKRFNK